MGSFSKIKKFKKVVWGYYKKEGRVFQWRKTKNSYEILVSEFMLQQTQTNRVEKKYEEFIKKFPTVRSLADASLKEVLETWQGLGYNRRALYLWRSAQEIVKKHGGKIPIVYNKLVTLPGIGPSTAGAVCAFAFNVPIPFIETNIRRAIIYFFFSDLRSVSDKKIFTIVVESMDIKNPREWYWALMDYGATLAKREKENPNKKSKHYVKQSKFEGSRRQARGKIMRELLLGPKKFLQLQKKLNLSPELTRELIGEMKKEGMVKEKNGKVFL